MNIIGTILLGILVIGMMYGFFKLRSYSKSEGVENPKTLRLVSWGIGIVGLLTIIWAVDAFIVKLPNAFKGPTVGNDIPSQGMDPRQVTTPELKVDPVSPDVGALRDEHRKQLEDFEK